MFGANGDDGELILRVSCDNVGEDTLFEYLDKVEDVFFVVPWRKYK